MSKNTVLISGAGIGGLTLANALQSKGIPYKVFETVPKILPLGAGILLAGNAIKVYDRIGIMDEVLKAGNLIKEAHILDRKGKLISVTSMKNVQEKYGYPGAAFHRAKLQEALLNTLPDDVLELGKHSVRCEQGKDRVQVHFSDSTQAEGKILIAADGIHSNIRLQMFTNSYPRYAGYTCWRGLCHYKDNTLKRQILTESWGWGERFGVVPLHNDWIYWFMVKNAPPQNPLMSAFSRETMMDIFCDWHFPVPQLLEATKEIDIIWNDIIDIHPLSQWTKGRLALLGDAAHAMTPNMGQGACQAIEDAMVLANCLEKYGLSEEALQHYENIRIKRANLFLTRSRQFGKMAQLENPLLTPFRNFIFRLTPKFMMEKQLEFLYDVSFDV